MLCEKCKIREANIKYTEVINGVKTEHNLCSQCAREMDFGHYSIFDGDFPLGKLLSSLLGVEESSQKEDKLQQIVCPTCGTSYQEFADSKGAAADMGGYRPAAAPAPAQRPTPSSAEARSLVHTV